jgi:hypothetical protein
MNAFKEATAVYKEESSHPLVIAFSGCNTFTPRHHIAANHRTSDFAKTFSAKCLLSSAGHKTGVFDGDPENIIKTAEAYLEFANDDDLLHEIVTNEQFNDDFSLPKNVSDSASINNDFVLPTYKWESALESDRIDIILADETPSWCNCYSIHIDATKPEFDQFIAGVLENPRQDLMALIESIRRAPSPRVAND